MAQKINACWCQQREGKISLGRHRRRWENNIKMDLIKVGWEGLEWNNLPQQRYWRALWNTIINSPIRQNEGNMKCSTTDEWPNGSNVTADLHQLSARYDLTLHTHTHTLVQFRTVLFCVDSGRSFTAGDRVPSRGLVEGYWEGWTRSDRTETCPSDTLSTRCHTNWPPRCEGGG